MRQLAFILFLFAATWVATADDGSYTCIVCGRGLLTGRNWMSKWGPVCPDCYKLDNHCLICGLPIRKDFIKTGDGRFICKFDRANAVLTAPAAQEVFADTRRELAELFGRGFALNFPDVTVNLFDVDYWSEKGREDGLHKFGFSYTRKTRAGDCTHEVVLLSGRSRAELAATAAHEYTHLWINENRPTEHVIDGDTTEAICELAAYNLMQVRQQPELVQAILANPYTHGVIKDLVALEQEKGIAYILEWVKTGTAATLAPEAARPAALIKNPVLIFTNVPAIPLLPTALKLEGLFLAGDKSHASINGVLFTVGDIKKLKLKNRTVRVSCREIHDSKVIVDVAGLTEPFTLRLGVEEALP